MILLFCIYAFFVVLLHAKIERYFVGEKSTLLAKMKKTISHQPSEVSCQKSEVSCQKSAVRKLNAEC